VWPTVGIDLARLTLLVHQLDGKEDMVRIGPDDPLKFEWLKVTSRVFFGQDHQQPSLTAYGLNQEPTGSNLKTL
jgi:hypothetical protein